MSFGFRKRDIINAILILFVLLVAGGILIGVFLGILFDVFSGPVCAD
tara:strand:- start:7 stop:147 length:141 start_codon:yes stop_codon:yes gene_type:complete